MKKLALILALLTPVLGAADVVVVSPGGGKNQEWLVTNAAGGSTLTNFTYRKSVMLQNLGPNAIYCTFDGQTPVATGALGYKIESGVSFSAAVSDNVTVKCIAATAAQLTTAATQVLELR